MKVKDHMYLNFNKVKKLISKSLRHLIKTLKTGIFIQRTRDNLITVLEIDTDHVKLAQFRKTAVGLRWVKLVTRRIPPGTSKDEFLVIKELLEEIHPSNKGCIEVSFPRHFTIIKNVILPSTSENEIENMVAYQASRYVPYGQDEISVDYRILEKREDGYAEVMLVIAHRDMVERYTRILEEVGINPHCLRLASEAISGCYLHSRDGWELSKEEVVASIDIGSSFTNIQIIRGETLVYTRSIDVGSAQVFMREDTSKATDELLGEIAGTFAVHDRKRSRERISRIVLSGTAAQRPEFRKLMERRFCLPVEIMNPLAGFDLSDEVADDIRNISKEFSFSTLIGLAIKGPEKRVNLLPKTLLMKRKGEARKRDLIRTGIFFLSVVILASSLLYKKIDNKEKYQDSLDKQVLLLTPLVEKLETMKREMDLIEKELRVENSVLDVLRELYQIIPERISLSLFSFDMGDKLTLKGSSPTMTEVLDLIPKLEKSGLFQKVTVQYLNKRQQRDQEFVDFLIDLRLGLEE